jgi:thiamine biosynthesis lipoprotein
VPQSVAVETAELVAASVSAWAATDGRFDPTVGDAMVACGYDRTFDSIDTATASGVDVMRPPGCVGIEVDLTAAIVTLPPGVSLDVGGIAKGFAADRIATALVRSGAAGACVNVGGDTRVIGNDEGGVGWTVAVEHSGIEEVAQLEVFDGGIATTSTRRRRWRRAGEELHHVLDPATGRPVTTGIAGVTVVASSATSAEFWTKAILVEGSSSAAKTAHDVAAIVVVTEDGEVRWDREPVTA